MTFSPGAPVKRNKLLLVDDHQLVLDGLRSRLARDFDIVATVTRGSDVLEACRTHHPDAVLLDLTLPDRGGLEVIRQLRAAHLDLRILIVSMHNDRVVAEAVLLEGANGYVPKDAPVEELRHALDEVLAGKNYLSPRLQAPVKYSATDAAFGLTVLSAQQRQVVMLIGECLSPEQIGEKMGLSANTIAYHRGQIRHKLGFVSEGVFVRFAMLARMAQVNEGETAG